MGKVGTDANENWIVKLISGSKSVVEIVNDAGKVLYCPKLSEKCEMVGKHDADKPATKWTVKALTEKDGKTPIMFQNGNKNEYLHEPHGNGGCTMWHDDQGNHVKGNEWFVVQEEEASTTEAPSDE